MERCPRPSCNRAGDDLGTCIDAQSIMGCARYVPIDIPRDLVIRCTRCNITRALPLDDVMKGRNKVLCMGEVEVCSAVILRVDKPAGEQPAQPQKGIIQKAKDALKGT